MRTSKRDRLISVYDRVQRLLGKLSRLKRRPRTVIMHLFVIRDQLDVILRGKIR